MTKNFLMSVITVLVSAVFALLCAEGILRLKSLSMQNYDIEMWRYARELKIPSPDPVLGHEHLKNKSAILQSVEVRLNELGLRGPPIEKLQPGQRRIIVLGASMTLGWGVEEDNTMTATLERMFAEKGEHVQVLNAGVGNYNAERSVERFFRNLTPLEPTDIVVHYFLRDAEKLDAGGGNVLLRHSYLAVTAWIAMSRAFGVQGEKSIEDHYARLYAPDSEGYTSMRGSLRRLVEYAKQKNIRLYLAIAPDLHNLQDYKFSNIHETMRKLSAELGYTFVDFLPEFRNLDPKTLWAMPGDPHPNALGHKIMAETLFRVLQLR